MGVTKYLTKIQEQEEIVKGDRLRCDICGREVTVNKAGKGPLICCGQPMNKIGTVVEAGFKKYPKGWSKKSVKKFANTLTKEETNAAAKKGFFDKCVKKMTGKVDNPEGFCAAMKDEATGSTYWRGKDKSPQKAGKDIKAHQNVK
jgi:desulfoferrodoxin-like iron-binding protein